MTLSLNLLKILLTSLFAFGLIIPAEAQNSHAPLTYIDISLSPDKNDWNYRVNETASVEVNVSKFGVPIENTEIVYETGPEMMPAEKKGNMLLKNGRGLINIGTSKIPGFRQLIVKTEYKGKTYSNRIKVAYSPEKIEPTVLMPHDFNRFWEKGKADAAKIPFDAKLTHLPDLSTAVVDVYLVDLQNIPKGKRLYGYLCKPKAPGKYPAIFSPPGAGVKPTAPAISFAEQGFISFNIEIHGITPLLDANTYKSISNAFGSYWLNGLDDRDSYYYKSVYLGCSRAIDFLSEMPEWDGKNMIVTGGSQGGALAIVTAALNEKVTALVSFYPALCDITGYLHDRAGGWPHIFGPRLASITNTPAKLKTIAYYDVVNFAKNVKVPGFYSWGYNDDTCPPTSVFAAVNSIRAPKTVSLTPISGHWRFEETNLESLEWIKGKLR